MDQETLDRIALWRADPVTFVGDQFGATPDAWQAEVLKAFPYNRRLAIKSNKGPGKTAVLAWCIWNFLATRADPKVLVTSLTRDTLRDTIWAELRKWMGKSPLLRSTYEMTGSMINDKGNDDAFCAARAWSKSASSEDQADTLAGVHADNLLFVLDESGGIPDSVMVAAEAGLATGGETKILQAGNPTHLEGPLYRACTSQRHLWTVFEVTGDPDDPNRSPRISKEWAREQIDEWGKDNPWVMVNVFGKFPPASINSLLGPDDVEAAMNRTADPEEIKYAQKRLGIDVARFGDDSTVIFRRQGRVAYNPVELRNARSGEIAARVALERKEFGSEVELIDSCGGYSAGTEDELRHAGIYIIPVNAAGSATDPRYYNKRSEMWMEMAEWIKRGGCLPKDPQLKRELCAPTFEYRSGKFRVEEKKQIKERLHGSSPDKADALAMTFAIPEAPSGSAHLMGVQTALAINQTGKTNADYDPFDNF